MQADTSISNRNWLTELKMSPVRDAYTSYFNGVALTYPPANILCWFAQNLATVNARAASLKPAHLLACAQCVSSVCDLKGPEEWTRRWKGYLPLSLSLCPFLLSSLSVPLLQNKIKRNMNNWNKNDFPIQFHFAWGLSICKYFMSMNEHFCWVSHCRIVLYCAEQWYFVTVLLLYLPMNRSEWLHSLLGAKSSGDAYINASDRWPAPSVHSSSSSH